MWVATMAERPLVLLQHRLDYSIALIPGEVHVDVRRVHPLGVDEALEVEIELDGADVGDTQGIGHQRGRAGSPATDAWAAVNNVLHHQEIGGESLARDDAQLALQAGHNLAGQGRAVAFGCARVGPRLEHSIGTAPLGVVPGGHGYARHGDEAQALGQGGGSG